MDAQRRVIVIGASAGGVDALFRIVSSLPADLAAPVLVVLHIGAHPSHLPELLATRGPLRAVFGQPGMVPEAGTIYVAPPDHHMLLEKGALRLVRGPKEHFARPAIDPLFRSAALDGGPAVIGVVLTGMLEDGSAGLRAIKACGGTAVVQDPAEAEEPSMPRSAMSSVQVDHVVGLQALGGLLTQLAQPIEPGAAAAPQWLQAEHAVSLGQARLEELGGIGAPSAYTCPECGGALFELTHGRPVKFLCHTGHAFGLRSLLAAQEAAVEDKLWAALRALQEKEAMLRRIAALQASEAPGTEAATLDEVRRIAALATQIRDAASTREAEPAPAPVPATEDSGTA